jgi:hypothetical protein
MLSRHPTAVTGVATFQGGKAEPVTVVSVTAHAPLEERCYTAMAAAQGGCPVVTKAVSSPPLRIRRVNIAMAEVICGGDAGDPGTGEAVQPPTSGSSGLHVDLVGLLPTSPEGYKYKFTIIDRSSRWLEAVPVKNTRWSPGGYADLGCRPLLHLTAAPSLHRQCGRPCARGWASNTSPPQHSTLAVTGWWREPTSS